MFRAFFLILFLLFPLVGCFARHYPGEQNNLTDANKLTDPYTWDFGKVKEGEILKHSFTFKNDSSKTLSIKKVDTSCGCTASKVKKKNLLAGESTLIETSFNTKGYSGPTKQYIYVHTDNLDTSTALSVNGEQSRTIDKPVIRFIIKAQVLKQK